MTPPNFSTSLVVSNLPGLTNRNFALGYFLPSVLFCLILLTIVSLFHVLPEPLTFDFADEPMNVLTKLARLILFSLLVGTLLLATNRKLLRFMEGYELRAYGRVVLIRLLEREKKHYSQKTNRLSELDSTYPSYSDSKEPVRQEQKSERNELLIYLAERFPDDKRWLLPTSFGNTIRAFEVYSRIMYGIDAVSGWERLLAVIPEDYRLLIDNAKAQVDLWANLWILNLLLIIGYFSTVICALVSYCWVNAVIAKPDLHVLQPLTIRDLVLFHAVTLKASLILATALKLLVPLLLITFAFFAFEQATLAAAGWGNFVKAAFDLYLPALREKLGFPQPKSMEEERKMWQQFSQAIIYRNPSSLPNRAYESPEPEDSDNR